MCGTGGRLMVTEDEALAIKTRVAPQLLVLPGVTAVGLGSKETGGRPTGELALKVFVTVKRPAGQVAAAELIPAEIDGLRTDVIQSGARRLLAAPPGAYESGEEDPTRARSGRPRSPTSASSPAPTRSPWPRCHYSPTTYASAAPGRSSPGAS